MNLPPFREWVAEIGASFYVCARCGRAEWSGVALFCPSCSWLLLEYEAPSERARSWEHGFLTRWLFDWTLDSDSTVGAAVRALKSGARRLAWRSLAAHWGARALDSEVIRPVFVPSPSRDGVRDHAFAFAEELASVWGGRLELCLGFPMEASAKPQKKLGAAARRKRILIAKYFPKLAARETLVFVDDVITTGSTARAAHSALGRPSDFVAWALASRPKVVKFGEF